MSTIAFHRLLDQPLPYRLIQTFFAACFEESITQNPDQLQVE